MIDAIFMPIVAITFYLIGRVHGHDAAKATEARLLESSVQELKELRKWKADNIGKEKV